MKRRTGLATRCGALLVSLGCLASAKADYSAACDVAGSKRERFQGVEAFFIPSGSALYRGQACQIGKSQLVMQTDGNLVLYDEKGKARWAASWGRREVMNRGHRAEVQTDQNFVVYDAQGNALWASNTFRGSCCARLAVQSDGNVVLYQEWAPIWTTNTAH